MLDKEGRALPTAANMISFKVTGEGALIGVGNGDPNCQESDKEPKRSLFNGLAQVIVQSSKTPGTITVEAFTESWPPPKLPADTVDDYDEESRTAGQQWRRQIQSRLFYFI